MAAAVPVATSVGDQLMVAFPPTVMVSLVPDVFVRVTDDPLVLPIVPWKAWAFAFCGNSAAVAIASVAQEMRSLFRLAQCAGVAVIRVIGKSKDTAWWAGKSAIGDRACGCRNRPG